jgi:hypothetical protein
LLLLLLLLLWNEVEIDEGDQSLGGTP